MTDAEITQGARTLVMASTTFEVHIHDLRRRRWVLESRFADSFDARVRARLLARWGESARVVECSFDEGRGLYCERIIARTGRMHEDRERISRIDRSSRWIIVLALLAGSGLALATAVGLVMR